MIKLGHEIHWGINLEPMTDPIILSWGRSINEDAYDEILNEDSDDEIIIEKNKMDPYDSRLQLSENKLRNVQLKNVIVAINKFKNDIEEAKNSVREENKQEIDENFIRNQGEVDLLENKINCLIEENKSLKEKLATERIEKGKALLYKDNLDTENKIQLKNKQKIITKFRNIKANLTKKNQNLREEIKILK